MPTLELMTEATHPDGWRQVRAPGGYESWGFIAHTARNRTCVIAGLHLGHSNDATYVRRYRAYEKFPTRNTPPVPAEYPSVSLTVVHDDTLVWQMLQPQRGLEFSAMTHTGQVRIGSSHVETAADGSIHLRMRAGEKGRIATVDLVFKPRPVATCAELVDGPHRVAMVEPVCDVDGELELFDPGQQHPTLINFAGAGTHEHRYGLRMIDAPMISGASVEDGKGLMVHGVGAQWRVLEIDDRDCSPLAVSPTQVRVIDPTCAVYDVTSEGRKRSLFCETVNPITAMGSFLRLRG